MFNGSEGSVVSGGARAAFVVGGTSDGTASGALSGLLWTLDVDAGTRCFAAFTSTRPERSTPRSR